MSATRAGARREGREVGRPAGAGNGRGVKGGSGRESTLGLRGERVSVMLFDRAGRVN
jgi:hypothetical protein